MPSPTKRQRLSNNSSPSKSSPLAKSAATSQSKGKGKAPARVASPTPRIRRQLSADHNDSEEDDEEELYSAEEDDPQPPDGPSFVTASSGDAYLLHSASASKTSDALLSSTIDPAFTFSSYASALSTYDSLELGPLVDQRDARQAKVDAPAQRYSNWVWEMQQGFNILLYGLGSKRDVLNAFAEKARTKGTVVVVNGCDPATTLADIVSAIEDVVRATNREAELQGNQNSKKRGRNVKGKGKAGNQDTAAPAAKAPPPSSSVSAMESRVRRLSHSLLTADKSLKDIFLVVHNLDGPTVRPTKSLSLLALLAAHPRIHLLASVDHLRAALLFPTSVATTRPPHLAGHSLAQNAPDLPLPVDDIRAFTFLYYEVSTLLPLHVEVSHAGTLSRLLPATIFPRLSTSLDPSSSSLAQSTAHVLASVTDRAKRLFGLLGRTQMELYDSVGAAVARGMLLTPASTAPCPPVAILLDKFKDTATDRLYASHNDQVDGLLAEFRDHGVVRGGMIPPAVAAGEGGDGENDDDDGEEAGAAARKERGEWVWIPLTREALEQVLDELGGED